MFYKKAKRFLAALCAWSLIVTSVDQGAMVVMAAEETEATVEVVAEETESVSTGEIEVVVSDGNTVTVSTPDVVTVSESDVVTVSESDVVTVSVSDVVVDVPVIDMNDGEDASGSTSEAPEGYVWVENIAGAGYFWNAETGTALFARDIFSSEFAGNTTIKHIVFQEGAVTRTIEANAFTGCTALETVDLSNCSNIEGINKEAFNGCTSLREITFSDELQRIGESAFKDCTSLTSVTLTVGLREVEKYAFKGCSSLSTVVVKANNMACTSSTTEVFKDCTISTITFDGCTAVPAYLFKKATFVEDTTVTIPATVQIIQASAFAESNLVGIEFAGNSSLVTIGESAFHKCTDLAGITFPASVKTIGKSAFYQCTGLTTVVIPDNITSVGTSAFEECTGITSVTLSKNITELGDAVFRKCTNLTSVTIPKNITKITNYMFAICSKLESVTIEDSVTTIGSNAFDTCEALSSITIPDSVKTIGSSTFKDCVALRTVVMSKNVTVFSDSIFKNCAALAKITTTENPDVEDGLLVIPKAVTHIGANAFDSALRSGGAGAPETLIISENVTNIGRAAFNSCRSVKTLKFESTKLQTCGQQIFANCLITSVTLPEGMTVIPENLFYSAGFQGDMEITIPKTVTTIGASAFAGTLDAPANIVRFTFESPAQVTTIGNNAFQYCTTIEAFTIPDTVTGIGSGAFANCQKLTSITIPENVTSIGKEAFNGCTVLETINYNAIAVTSANQNVFSNCNVDTITIGDKVKYIPAYFLENAKFSTNANQEEVDIIMNIPASVEKIGKHAFYGIDNLTQVNIASGSVLSDIGESAFEGCTTLASCVLPDCVDLIGARAFYGCEKLTTMDVPVCVKSIGTNAFSGCSELTRVSMNTLITSIGDGAFTGCSNAKFYVVEGSYAEQWLIANGFGEQIEHINSITYELDGGINDERNIGGYENGDDFTFYPAVKPGFSFEGWYKESTFTTAVTTLDGCTGDLTLYAKFNYGVEGDASFVESADGVYKFSEDKGVLIVSASVGTIATGYFKNLEIKDKIKHVVFEENSQLTLINNNAFEGLPVLASVDFGNCSKLTNIGVAAFKGCTSLSTIKFSENLLVIEASAFENCTSLKTVTLSAKLTSIGKAAFAGCTMLETVIVEAADPACGDGIFTKCNIKDIQFVNVENIVVPDKLFFNATFADDADIVIPSHIQEIGESAFANCATLKKITIEDTKEKPSALSQISSKAFSKCTGLASITFPSNLKTIGMESFSGCTAFTRVTIPNNVITLETKAFSDCTAVTEIELANAISEMGTGIFQKCTSLTSVKIPDGIKLISGYMFADCTNLTTVEIAGTVAEIGNYAFSNTALNKVDIPGSVKTVGTYVFNKCTALATVNVADGVESLGNHVFIDCAALTSVTIADSVTFIGPAAFSNCTSLNNPILPKELTQIGNYLFSNCRALTVISTSERTAQVDEKLVLPDTVTYIGISAFEGCVAITGVTIPKNVTEIGTSAFEDCKSLSSVTIESLEIEECGVSIFQSCQIAEVVFPEGLTEIPAYLFNKAGFITEVTITIPATVTKIGNYAFGGGEKDGEAINVAKFVFEEGSKLEVIGTNAFEYCVNITEFKIPETVAMIGSAAFARCQKLKEITIPENVIGIGANAFLECKNLTTVYFNAIAVITTNQNIFKGCNLHTILLGEKIMILPANLFRGANFATISGDSEAKLIKLMIPASVVEIGDYALANIANISEVIFAEGSMLKTVGAYAFNSCKELTACELPATVETIGAFAFGECAKLKAMNLPETVISIGSGAFKNCESVTSYVVPKGIRKIEDDTFYGNAELTSITFEAAETEADVVVSIGANAFAECPKLAEVVIPEGVTSIGASAFSGDTGLLKVRIPVSVTAIGDNAFKGCTSTKFYVVRDSFAEKWLKDNNFSTQIEYMNTITYVLNDGVNDVRNIGGYLDGESFEFYPATKPGYAFDGWYLDETFKTEIKDVKGHTGDLTLYANWGEKLEYKITYELDGGENHKDNPDTYTYDEKASVSLKTPTKYGYTFVGWYTDKQDTKSKISSIKRSSCVDYVLYAVWKPKSVSVTFGFDKNVKDAVFVDENGKESKSLNKTVTFGEPYGEMPVPVREKYLFDGWYTEKGEPITEATVVSVAEPHKLIARWVFDVRVAVPTSTPASGSVVDKGTKVILTTETPGADIYYTMVTYTSDTTDGEDATTDGADATTDGEDAVMEIDGEDVTCADPTPASTLYTGPITITENTIIKAIGVKENYKNSEVSEFVFKVVSEAAYWGDVAEEDRGLFKNAAEVPEGIWVAGVKDTEYTGSAITFDIRVYDHKTLLTLKTDYTVKYSNNKTVPKIGSTKKPTVTITGKGNYKGKWSVPFNILPKNIGDEDVIVDDIWLAANPSKPYKPVPTALWGKFKLKNKKDFIVSYDPAMGYTGEGEFSMKLEGTGNYTGTRTIKCTLTTKNLISKVKVSGYAKSMPYTGKPVTQSFVVKDGSIPLSEGTHYDVKYDFNTEIGTAYFVLIGKGDYAGIKRIAFQISPIAMINKVKFDLNMKSVPYTGSAITLNEGSTPLKITSASYKGMYLKEGEDYVVTGYSNNVNAGTATIHLKGINEYSGTAKKTFKIAPANIGGLKLKYVDADGKVVDSVKYPYSKGGSKPSVHLEYNGKILRAGTDYTVSYKKNTKLGLATLTVKGKKNFTGSLLGSFTVVQQDISNVSINIPDVEYKAEANIYASKPVLTDVDGKKLASKKDYDATVVYTYATACTVKQGSTSVSREQGDVVNSKDIIPLGTILKATVKGAGNYTGEISGYYRIVTTSIAKAKVTVLPQQYTGKAVQPGKEDITVLVNGVPLKDTDYEIVGYSKNVAKGTATVTLRGTGEYGGTVTAKFKIIQKNFIIEKVLNMLGF